MRSPPQAPQNGSTREFADLDGVGVALQAKAAQALPGILIGQIEAPLQVLSGRLLHVQLLCILLVKEANFLPKKTGRWSVKSPAFLPDFHASVPKASLPADGSSSFPHWSARKSKSESRPGGRGTKAQLLFSLFGHSLTLQPRLALNSQQSYCLSLPSDEFISGYY